MIQQYPVGWRIDPRAGDTETVPNALAFNLMTFAHPVRASSQSATSRPLQSPVSQAVASQFTDYFTQHALAKGSPGLDTVRHLVIFYSLFDANHTALNAGKDFKIKGRGVLTVQKDQEGTDIRLTLRSARRTKVYSVSIENGATQDSKRVDRLIRGALQTKLAALPVSAQAA